MTHANRESWLTEATELMKPWFCAAGRPLAVPVRVTIGFPSRGALSVKRRRVGECWSVEASSDGHAEICVSPLLDDPVEIGAVLLHELAHAALGVRVGHRAPFARLVAELGLDGRPTATVPGEKFQRRFDALEAALGPLPHARLNVPTALREKKTDTCRQLRVECPTCGYLARVTQKWLDVGAPLCPVDRLPLTCEGE